MKIIPKICLLLLALLQPFSMSGLCSEGYLKKPSPKPPLMEWPPPKPQFTPAPPDDAIPINQQLPLLIFLGVGFALIVLRQREVGYVYKSSN